MKKNNKKIVLNKTEQGKHINIFLVFSITLIMIVLILGSLVKADRDMSENENRYLTQMPEISVGSILEGKFESQLEDYLSDQIIGRENWIKIMSNVLEGIGYKDIKGVYLLDDGRLAERITASDFKEDRFSKNLNEIVKLDDELLSEDSDAEIRVMLVPSAAYSYRNEFNVSTSFNEAAAFDKAKDTLGSMYVDLKDELMPADSASGGDEGRADFYYKTDHHWNYQGAWKAACAYDNILGIEEEKYDPVELADGFMGTLYSKVLLNDRVRDKIEAPADSMDADVKVTIEGKEYDSVYFMDRLEQKDKYEVFFGGNYDKVDIENRSEEAQSKQKLLVIKDSYANSFVPFILDDFSEITMIDTRYYRDSVEDLIIDGEYDQVLILYSITNFAEEKLNLTSKAII